MELWQPTNPKRAAQQMTARRHRCEELYGHLHGEAKSAMEVACARASRGQGNRNSSSKGRQRSGQQELEQQLEGPPQRHNCHSLLPKQQNSSKDRRSASLRHNNHSASLRAAEQLRHVSYRSTTRARRHAPVALTVQQRGDAAQMICAAAAAAATTGDSRQMAAATKQQQQGRVGRPLPQQSSNNRGEQADGCRNTAAGDTDGRGCGMLRHRVTAPRSRSGSAMATDSGWFAGSPCDIAIHSFHGDGMVRGARRGDGQSQQFGTGCGPSGCRTPTNAAAPHRKQAELQQRRAALKS